MWKGYVVAWTENWDKWKKVFKLKMIEFLLQMIGEVISVFSNCVTLIELYY